MNNVCGSNPYCPIGRWLVGWLNCWYALRLVPLFVGRNKGRDDLGFAGLITCIVVGPFFGLLLAGPAAIIFTVIIVSLGPKRKRRRRYEDDDEDDDEDDLDDYESTVRARRRRSRKE